MSTPSQENGFGNRIRDRLGDLLPVNDTLTLFTVFIIVVIGWLVISTIQYIFQRFILNQIMSFWALMGMALLLIILYYSLVKATQSSFYLFPLVAANERLEI